MIVLHVRHAFLYISLPYSSKQQRALDSSARTTTSTRFSHKATVSARKPASFWREKRDAAVILVRGFAKMSSNHG